MGDAFGERNVFCAVAVPGAGGDQTHRAKRMTPDAERDADVGAGVGAAQGFEVLGVAIAALCGLVLDIESLYGAGAGHRMSELTALTLVSVACGLLGSSR